MKLTDHKGLFLEGFFLFFGRFISRSLTKRTQGSCVAGMGYSLADSLGHFKRRKAETGLIHGEGHALVGLVGINTRWAAPSSHFQSLSSRASRQESEVTWSQELELSSGVLALGKDILGAC